MTITITNAKDLKTHIAALKAQGKTIGFVPTMGALHDGHLSLVELAKQHADVVVVSIFVNPAQFAPHEDFDSYPRTNEADVQKLETQQVDIAYLPTREDIYPDGIDADFTVGEIGQILEGKPRPHFFDGVGQVVLRLFEQTLADVAVFGEKDFQQLTIIKKLVKERDVKVNIVGGEIKREASGLAMSSRNVYLNETERKIAALLYITLQKISDEIREGEPAREVIPMAKKMLLQGGFDAVDYLEIRDSESLAPWEGSMYRSARILGAARLGKVRLIDNILL